MPTDIIAAIATPPGAGGVGIVRVSGAGAREIGEELFVSGREGFVGLRPYRLHHGRLVYGGRVLDEALAAFMPGPGSYTGEDVVEFYCHGGPAVLRSVLEALFGLGARQAGPGEFTLRAYLNGRMDLTQAEAVAELISASSEGAADLARERLAGHLGERVRAIRERLLGLRSRLCLAVDFPEDEIEESGLGDLATEVGGIGREVRALADGYRRGRLRREGAAVILAGEVNAGKSSLLNALIGRERAIVSDAPGTTRDYLEETLDVEGLAVRVFDTAGLRETGDEVELAGVRRSRELLESADLVLLVVDGSSPLSHNARELAAGLGPEKILAVVNKADLPGIEPDPGAELAAMGIESVRLSAKTGRGVDELTAKLGARLLAADSLGEGEVAPNRRQAESLEKAARELSELKADAEAGLSPDLLGVRLETACDILAEITGEILPDEVLSSIFEKFCIGK